MLLKFGNYELNTSLYELRCNGSPIRVEPQVFNLLVYLAQNRDHIASRQELMDKLWADKVVSESTLSSSIKAARQAIGDSGRAQHCIATYSRRGYRFVAEVEEHNAGDDQQGVVNGGETTPSQQHLHHSDRPFLVVLPFVHNQGDDEIAWTAEMFAEDIGIQLARIPGFLVVSRNSAAYYRGREFSVGQIGRELSADYVIKGSLRKRGTTLYVSVQLLETANGRLLWANRTEIPAEELADFQEDTVREIANSIEPEVNRAELTALRHRRPVDLGAWALYRQGHATLSLKGWSEESFSEAAGLLRQAIRLDPELAFAHAYLALILAIGDIIGLITDEGWREEAEAAAEAAIALDSQDSDVLGYVGCALADMGDYQRGAGMIRRAIELNPSNAQAHAALGAVMLRLGEEEGIAEMRFGIRMSPRDNRLGIWGALLAQGLVSFGHVAEAIEVADHACSCDDKNFLPRIVLAVAQNVAKNPVGSRAALDDARRIRPQLAIDDIARLAGPKEIEGLRRSGVL